MEKAFVMSELHKPETFKFHELILRALNIVSVLAAEEVLSGNSCKFQRLSDRNCQVLVWGLMGFSAPGRP